MRIALQTSTDLVWLAGTPDMPQRIHSWASDVRINGEIITDIIRYLRAAAVTVRDRGNLQTEISFSTVRQFGTVASAEAWAADYDAAMPRTGELILEFISPDGSSSRRQLSGTVVPPPERTVIGVSVMLSYRALGGALSVATAGPSDGGGWEDWAGVWGDN